MEFLKSADNMWTSRNNAYTITKMDARKYIVRDGHGKLVLVPAKSLREAKEFAQLHADGAR